MSEQFSEADLAPSAGERRQALAVRLDRLASTFAVLAVGVVVGGMIALGACAAPFVFGMTPAPFSGNAMAAAFARFDRIAIGCSALMLAAELARTFLARRDPPSAAGRVRRFVGIAFAGCVAYVALAITPGIASLHGAGAVRGEGDAGQRLDALHKRAELLGKLELALGAAAIGLHVFTAKAKREDDDEDFESPAAPGPRD